MQHALGQTGTTACNKIEKDTEIYKTTHRWQPSKFISKCLSAVIIPQYLNVMCKSSSKASERRMLEASLFPDSL